MSGRKKDVTFMLGGEESPPEDGEVPSTSSHPVGASASLGVASQSQNIPAPHRTPSEPIHIAGSPRLQGHGSGAAEMAMSPRTQLR